VNRRSISLPARSTAMGRTPRAASMIPWIALFLWLTPDHALGFDRGKIHWENFIERSDCICVARLTEGRRVDPPPIEEDEEGAMHIIVPDEESVFVPSEILKGPCPDQFSIRDNGEIVGRLPLTLGAVIGSRWYLFLQKSDQEQQWALVDPDAATWMLQSVEVRSWDPHEENIVVPKSYRYLYQLPSCLFQELELTRNYWGHLSLEFRALVMREVTLRNWIRLGPSADCRGTVEQ